MRFAHPKDHRFTDLRALDAAAAKGGGGGGGSGSSSNSLGRSVARPLGARERPREAFGISSISASVSASTPTLVTPSTEGLSGRSSSSKSHHYLPARRASSSAAAPAASRPPSGITLFVHSVSGANNRTAPMMEASASAATSEAELRQLSPRRSEVVMTDVSVDERETTYF